MGPNPDRAPTRTGPQPGPGLQLAANKAVIENKCKQDIQNKTTENSLLIHELNMLRVERKTLQRQVKDLQLRDREKVRLETLLALRTAAIAKMVATILIITG